MFDIFPDNLQPRIEPIWLVFVAQGANVLFKLLEILVWPVTTIALVILLRKELRMLLSRVSRAELPGGVKIDFKKEAERAKSLSLEVKSEEAAKHTKTSEKLVIQSISDANSKLVSLGLRASPSNLDLDYYRDLAKRDPALALAGLRMEMEIMGQNLAKGFDVNLDRRTSARLNYEKLAQEGAITRTQLELVKIILNLCNLAVHGEPVSFSDAEKVIETAGVLRNQFLDWLALKVQSVQ
jgi:hypothetical protein